MSPDAVHNSTQSESYVSPPVTIILTVILLVFFFVGFFSIYFCRCFMENLAASWHLRRNQSGTAVGRPGSDQTGLDPSIIDSFPKFTYSSVKDFRKGKDALECAICLSEFVDDDSLRLLTICCHVFHQDCIDLWLESHKTCPVCRRNLDDPEKLPQKCPILCNPVPEIDHNGDNPIENSVRISIKEDDDDYDEEGGRGEGAAHAAEGAPPQTASAAGHGKGKNTGERFSRSHSTGHSIVKIENEDKYTLRLPDHIQSRIVKKGHHNCTQSCTTFGDYSNKAAKTGNGRFGEVSGFSGGKVNQV